MSSRPDKIQRLAVEGMVLKRLEHGYSGFLASREASNASKTATMARCGERSVRGGWQVSAGGRYGEFIGRAGSPPSPSCRDSTPDGPSSEGAIG